MTLNPKNPLTLQLTGFLVALVEICGIEPQTS